MQSNFLTVEFVRCHRAVRPVQGPPPTRAMRALCGPQGHPRHFVINKNKIRVSELNVLEISWYSSVRFSARHINARSALPTL